MLTCMPNAYCETGRPVNIDEHGSRLLISSALDWWPRCVNLVLLLVVSNTGVSDNVGLVTKLVIRISTVTVPKEGTPRATFNIFSDFLLLVCQQLRRRIRARWGSVSE